MSNAEVWLQDDDYLKDGWDVPMPDTSDLDEALAKAFVSVAFDVGDNNDNVPFALNQTRPELVNSFDWDSKCENSTAYWVAYVLGAFQGDVGKDNDPLTENEVLGRTSTGYGGSAIYLETIRDSSVQHDWDALRKEQDNVVHEVGHALAQSGEHPVTRFTNEEIYSRYTDEYLKAIRESQKPAG